MLKIYGIKNCDTIKKTLKWFDTNSVPYQFIDYKKEAPTQDFAHSLLKEHNWETIINKRGTTWRKLSDETKNSIDAESAIPLMLENPSIIKRPIVEHKGQFLVGFNEEKFQKMI
jgi:arsenate reductase